MTLEYVEFQHKTFGKNEITTYFQDLGKMFGKVFGSCGSSMDEKCQMMQTQGNEINMNDRLSYVPIPVAHVLRDGKKYLIDAKDIISQGGSSKKAN